MRILLTPRARRDLREIHVYLEARSARGAENVMRRIRAAFLQLQDQPEVGITIEGADVRRLYTGRYPYVAYYRIKDDRVEIVHVRHTSRAGVDPEDLG